MGIDTGARINTSTLNFWIRKKIEPVFRSSFFLGALKSRGRISYNNGGRNIVWFPRFRRRTITAGVGYPASFTFPATNVRREATLPWRFYTMGESLSKFEKLVQQSGTAIFKLAQELVGQMLDDFTEDLRLKLYIDGVANANDLMGLESWFAASSVVTNSLAGDVSDTYAGLATDLGNYGGSWTADTGNGWPTGTGDAEYHAWSPLVVDYTNTGWAATTKTWPNTWQEATRYMMSYMEQLQSEPPQVLLLSGELLRQAKDSLEDVQRLELTQNSKFTSVGPGTLDFEGLEMASEYGVPSAVGYGLNFDRLELRSMQSGLIEKSTDMDITTSEDLIALDSYLQLVCESPAYQSKLVAIS
jgi:hypothetical protein